MGTIQSIILVRPPSKTLDFPSVTGTNALHTFSQTSVGNTRPQLPLGTIQCILLVRTLSKSSTPLHSQGKIQCILLVRSLSKTLHSPTLIGYNILHTFSQTLSITPDFFTLTRCNILQTFGKILVENLLPSYSVYNTVHILSLNPVERPRLPYSLWV